MYNSDWASNFDSVRLINVYIITIAIIITSPGRAFQADGPANENAMSPHRRGGSVQSLVAVVPATDSSVSSR